MSTHPSLPVVQRRAVNWRYVAEIVVMVLLAFVIAVVIIGLLLAISADQIGAG